MFCLFSLCITSLKAVAICSVRVGISACLESECSCTVHRRREQHVLRQMNHTDCKICFKVQQNKQGYAGGRAAADLIYFCLNRV